MRALAKQRFVSDAVTVRLVDLVALDGEALEFVGGVFAKPYLVDQFADEVGGVDHCWRVLMRLSGASEWRTGVGVVA
jgi:hypothetical protein